MARVSEAACGLKEEGREEGSALCWRHRQQMSRLLLRRRGPLAQPHVVRAGEEGQAVARTVPSWLPASCSISEVWRD